MQSHGCHSQTSQGAILIFLYNLTHEMSHLQWPWSNNNKIRIWDIGVTLEATIVSGTLYQLFLIDRVIFLHMFTRLAGSSWPLRTQLKNHILRIVDGSFNLTLSPGEALTISPFHWIVSCHLLLFDTSSFVYCHLLLFDMQLFIWFVFLLIAFLTPWS